jgi:PAS domain S-box-containing protein
MWSVTSSSQNSRDSEGDPVKQMKAADKATEEESELHRRLNLTPSMLAVLEVDGRFTWVNDVALQYFGLGAADFFNNLADLRSRAVHPDDFQRLREERQRAVASGLPFEYENRLRRHDGRYRWFLVRYQPLKDAAGRVVRWYGGAIDIEDRKRAEEALQRSEAYLAEAQRLSHTGSWAYIANAGDWVVRYWSDENFRIWGFDPLEGFPTTEMVRQRIHPEDRERAIAVAAKGLRVATDHSSEFRIVLPNGTVRHILSLGHSALRGGEDHIQMVGTHVDVTERKLAEKERERLSQLETDLIRAQKEQLIKAQEAERMRIAGELHDGVLQQLTSLTLRLGTIKYQVPPDSEAIAEISTLQEELIKVGTDVRHLSHELHPALLNVAGLPAALSSYCEEFTKVRGLTVTCETDESVRELSQGDALCIYRIAQEALGNAAKHSVAKKVEVRLTGSDSRVCLSVSDDGVGCSPGQIGSSGGLGLINMRERVLQLGGTFSFESEPGRGTTVKVEIPFRSPS